MSAGAAAIEATYGTTYPFGPGSEVLCRSHYLSSILNSAVKRLFLNFCFFFLTVDFTSGTTKDYVYGTLGVTHGYTLELRNTVDGFITPTTLIAPVATEAWNGIKAMANAIA